MRTHIYIYIYIYVRVSCITTVHRIYNVNIYIILYYIIWLYYIIGYVYKNYIDIPYPSTLPHTFPDCSDCLPRYYGCTKGGCNTTRRTNGSVVTCIDIVTWRSLHALHANKGKLGVTDLENGDTNPEGHRIHQNHQSQWWQSSQKYIVRIIVSGEMVKFVRGRRVHLTQERTALEQLTSSDNGAMQWSVKLINLHRSTSGQWRSLMRSQRICIACRRRHYQRPSSRSSSPKYLRSWPTVAGGVLKICGKREQ
jgi:hypothetical protein